ncbi:hypothetical protein IAD21_03167 [Abditibacteriota bacterium]|nr:hypothetical protein IAD21_03167 [Abditibacteriota bacterium]
MSLSLRERWLKQLEAAQDNSSWRAQIDVRILRFLLARYGGASEAAQLADFPLYEGEMVHGRAKALLSPREQEARLNHIARTNLERRQDAYDYLVSNDFFERGAWHAMRQRQKREAFEQFGQTPPPLSPPIVAYGPAWLTWLEFDVGKWVGTLLSRLVPPHIWRSVLSRILPRNFNQSLAKVGLGLKFLGRILSSHH